MTFPDFVGLFQYFMGFLEPFKAASARICQIFGKAMFLEFWNKSSHKLPVCVCFCEFPKGVNGLIIAYVTHSHSYSMSLDNYNSMIFFWDYLSHKICVFSVNLAVLRYSKCSPCWVKKVELTKTSRKSVSWKSG